MRERKREKVKTPLRPFSDCSARILGRSPDSQPHHEVLQHLDLDRLLAKKREEIRRGKRPIGVFQDSGEFPASLKSNSTSVNKTVKSRSTRADFRSESFTAAKSNLSSGDTPASSFPFKTNSKKKVKHRSTRSDYLPDHLAVGKSIQHAFPANTTHSPATTPPSGCSTTIFGPFGGRSTPPSQRTGFSGHQGKTSGFGSTPRRPEHAHQKSTLASQNDSKTLDRRIPPQDVSSEEQKGLFQDLSPTPALVNASQGYLLHAASVDETSRLDSTVSAGNGSKPFVDPPQSTIKLKSSLTYTREDLLTLRFSSYPSNSLKELCNKVNSILKPIPVKGRHGQPPNSSDWVSFVNRRTKRIIYVNRLSILEVQQHLKVASDNEEHVASPKLRAARRSG